MARRHLANDGAPALSLRAIARELGMTSSSIYRYVASRDDLLTRLIIDAYNALGASAEHEESRNARDDLRGRFEAVCLAVRSWAFANPHEYALIHGSPVPGYVAPADTIGPATRVSNLLVAILIDALESGRVSRRWTNEHTDPGVERATAPVRQSLPEGISASLIQRALMTWVGLYGMVSFELFGQFNNVLDASMEERELFFRACVDRWADDLGIA